MKKLSQIKGVTQLSRKEQQNIKGGACTQEGGLCCRTFPSGFELCEPGICRPTGYCFYY